jgi:hypothetical protein
MRLTKQVARVERAAERTLEIAAEPCGLIWTENEVRVDGRELEPGEYIAGDLFLGEEVGGGQELADLQARGERGCQIVRVVERKTRDVEDLGRVFSTGGLELGVVTRIEGTLLEWRFHRAGAAA